MNRTFIAILGYPLWGSQSLVGFTQGPLTSKLSKLRSYLSFEVILTTTVPKGIKPGVFVRVDNVAVIKLEDNSKF